MGSVTFKAREFHFLLARPGWLRDKRFTFDFLTRILAKRFGGCVGEAVIKRGERGYRFGDAVRVPGGRLLAWLSSLSPQFDCHLEMVGAKRLTRLFRRSRGKNDLEFDTSAYPKAAWAEVTLTGSAGPPALATLLVDRGQGFNQANAYRLGYLTKHSGSVRRFVPLRGARAIRLHISSEPAQLSVEHLRFRPVGIVRVAVHAAHVATKRRGVTGFVSFVASCTSSAGIRGIRRGLAAQLAHQDEQLLYQLWHEQTRANDELAPLLKSAAGLSRPPTISILIPVTTRDVRFLDRTLDSVRQQLYPHWQVCLAVERSAEDSVQTRLVGEHSDKTVCVAVDLLGNGFGQSMNRALDRVTGDFVALLNPGDELSEDAMLHAAVALSQGGCDVLYSDEDRIRMDGTILEPYFKPDWSPETLLSHNYVGRLCLYRKSLLVELGGFSSKRGTAAEYDLALRVTEVTSAVRHLPLVLYHRLERSSTAEDAIAGVRVLEDALGRRQLRGRVRPYRSNPGHYSVRIEPGGAPKISIIIPICDQAQVLAECLESIFNRTTYRNFDVLILNNRSREGQTMQLLDDWRRRAPRQLRVLDCDFEFNFARLVNAGVTASTGELVVLLNSDTSVVSSDWLEAMAGYALVEGVATVGAKLLYPDGMIQHAGVILVGGVAGHSHRGQASNSPGYRGRLLGPSNYSGVTAASMMMRRAVFNDLGGFDKSLAVAFNDVDFCLRALRRGYRHVCLGDVVLIHHESRTRGHDETIEKRERFQIEFELMRQRWASVLDADPYYSPHLTRRSEDFGIDPMHTDIENVHADGSSH
jgi:GT2 family glycosyltransferase